MAVFLSLILSQLIKMLLFAKDSRKLDFSTLLITGGMPSTHAALVTSLLVVVIFEQGFNTISAIALVLFIIVVTDAMGVRRSVGEEGKALNRIIKMKKLKMEEVKYAHGHKPREVLAGIVLGAAISIAVYFL